MEESSSSFSVIFNVKKNTICLHEVEIKITNGKCFIRGQRHFCARNALLGYHYGLSQKKSKLFLWVFLFILLELSLLMVLLCSGAKCTDLLFQEKSMWMRWVLPPPMLTWLLLLHILTMPPAPNLLNPPSSTLQKSPTRKNVSRHPFFRMLTL